MEYTTRMIDETRFMRNSILVYIKNYIENNKSDLLSEEAINIIISSLPKKLITKIINRISFIEKEIELSENPQESGEKDLLDMIKRIPLKITRRNYSNCIEFISENLKDEKLLFLERFFILKINSLLKEKDETDLIIDKLAELKVALKLSNDEMNCVMLFYLVENNDIFEDFARDIDLNKRSTSFRQTIKKVGLLTNISKTNLLKILSKNSPLQKYGVVDEDCEICDNISEFLDGQTNECLSTQFFDKYKGDCVDINMHRKREKDTPILSNLISQNEGTNILLYGSAGAGKTEYCKSLASHLKKDIYFIKNLFKNSRIQSETFRFSALESCQNSIVSENSIIVIDEADELLNGSSGFASLFGGSRNNEKNIVNEILDNNSHNCIWITNHYGSIEESTRRRFDYSIEFTKFNYEQRKMVWENSLIKHNLSAEFAKTEVAEFATKYDINAGGIDLVLKNYKAFPENNRSETVIENLVQPHLKLMNNQNINKLNPVKNYSLDGLNIKGEHSISDGLEILSEFSKFMRTPQYNSSEIRNMNLLLYGASGTGKTEFVKHLAQEIERNLLLKRGSDFLGKYVGETEQNIKLAFQEAEDDNAILFIDEADGLLFDRAKSSRSFEMTQVNELLVQMENFKGILVCSSNFQKNMDSATFRRFNLKFEFDYLDDCGVRKFYDIFLAELANCELRKNEISELSQINGLTPGDFKVVKQKYFFFKSKKIGHKDLINALKEEVKYKIVANSAKIGF